MLWPLIDVRISFPLYIVRKKNDRISPNFIYAIELTIYILRLLSVIFDLFVKELWPLIDVRISFSLNVFRTWPFYSMKRAVAVIQTNSLTILAIFYFFLF